MPATRALCARISQLLDSFHESCYYITLTPAHITLKAHYPSRLSGSSSPRTMPALRSSQIYFSGNFNYFEGKDNVFHARLGLGKLFVFSGELKLLCDPFSLIVLSSRFLTEWLEKRRRFSWSCICRKSWPSLPPPPSSSANVGTPSTSSVALRKRREVW